MKPERTILTELEARARKLARARAAVARLKDEVQIAKDNLKVAQTELELAIRDTCETAENEEAGILPLFNRAE